MKKALHIDHNTYISGLRMCNEETDTEGGRNRVTEGGGGMINQNFGCTKRERERERDLIFNAQSTSDKERECDQRERERERQEEEVKSV